ncbi:hypothetical protein HZU77_016105 [Neisseriaceae bacterium TC5R-5]|nr:hypothetical protein [Neisseriaceae bacterium TC5R-5]
MGNPIQAEPSLIGLLASQSPHFLFGVNNEFEKKKKFRQEIDIIISSLVAFNFEVITPEKEAQIDLLNVNTESGIRQAVEIALIPDFVLWLPIERSNFFDSLRRLLADEEEDFSELSDQMNWAFSDPPVDVRFFMATTLKILEELDLERHCWKYFWAAKLH